MFHAFERDPNAFDSHCNALGVNPHDMHFFHHMLHNRHIGIEFEWRYIEPFARLIKLIGEDSHVIALDNCPVSRRGYRKTYSPADARTVREVSDELLELVDAVESTRLSVFTAGDTVTFRVGVAPVIDPHSPFGPRDIHRRFNE